MSWKRACEKVRDGHWVLPRTKTMRVDAHLFLSDRLLFGDYGVTNHGVEEQVFGQIVTAASFPGVTRVAIMPDTHTGYGVPIGCVVETEGVLLPTAAGYDIGCGILLLQTSLSPDDVADPTRRSAWVSAVTKRVALGAGAPRVAAQRQVSRSLFDEVLRHGARALGRTDARTERDLLPVEDDRIAVPDRARAKHDQLGSLGGGNHFIELQQGDDARIYVMVHTGSRGFGWTIAKQFFVEGATALGLSPRDEDHVWIDAVTAFGRAYWNLHNMAGNFAIGNRLLIAEAVREALDEVFAGDASVLYEISHNLIQLEDGRFVARKGATRAFRPAIPRWPRRAGRRRGTPSSSPARWRPGAPSSSRPQGRRNRSTPSITAPAAA